MLHNKAHHGHDSFIPTFNDLSHSNLEGERLLSGIFCAPKLLGKIAVLAISCAMHGDVLASGGVGASSFFQDLLFKSHLVKASRSGDDENVMIGAAMGNV